MSFNALHRLLERDKAATRCADVQQILDNNPEAAGKPNKDEWYPLHCGMRYKAPADVIKVLVAACPEAAGEPNKYGMYPLHLAMMNSAPADVIKVVFDACPEAAGKPNKDGKCPLHWGMQYKAPVDVIKMLVDACPEAAGKPGEYGMYPLHHGMRYKIPADVIKVVVAACPEAAGKPDQHGRYPLYWGMKNNAPADAIKVVFDAYPEAADPQPYPDWTIDYSITEECIVFSRPHFCEERPAMANHSFREMHAVVRSEPLATQTLGGDILLVRNWLPVGDAASPSNPQHEGNVDMTQAVAEQNGLLADELKPVLLDKKTLQLSSPVLFKPLTAVPLTVVGMAVRAGDGADGNVAVSSSGPADAEHAMAVNLAVEDVTVGYVLRKVEALLDVRANLQPLLYADRLWKVEGDGPAARKVRLSFVMAVRSWFGKTGLVCGTAGSGR